MTTDWQERCRAQEMEHTTALSEARGAARSKIAALEYEVEKAQAHEAGVARELATQKEENSKLARQVEILKKESGYLNAQLATKDSDYKRRLVAIIQERAIPCYSDQDY